MTTMTPIGRVLVVDDDRALRHALAALLQDAGYQTEQAADGPAALATLERQAERLTVSHRNPEKFHEDKSELVAALARLRRRLEGQ